MIEYKRILFCTDFSEDANIAFYHALDLAKKYGGKLHILHIPHSSYSYCRHIVDEHVPEGASGSEAFSEPDGRLGPHAVVSPAVHVALILA